MLSRWIGLIALALVSLGPGLFWSPGGLKDEAGNLSQGWNPIPLPQQFGEAKTKLSSFGLGLVAALVVAAARSRVRPVWATPAFPTHAPQGRKLYLIYSRLQTDGG